MVYLSRIYTKTGDQGETALGDGTRVAKDHPRVAAYGTVDELNAVLGLILLHLENATEGALIRDIQNDLFDVGADLCAPQSETARLRIEPSQTERLERAIDRLNADLGPLTSFVLPGGREAAAWCHFARTICRRAERDVVTLSREDRVNPQVVIYLNRLSDLLFVFARVLNDRGQGDVLWMPGKTARRTEPGAEGNAQTECESK